MSKKKISNKKKVLLTIDLCLYLAILSVLVIQIGYYNNHPEYFIANPLSNYEGVPYLTDCSESLHYPDSISKVKIGDKYCSYVVGSEYYIKEVSPVVYYVIKYQNILLLGILSYWVLTNIPLIKKVWRKIKDE